MNQDNAQFLWNQMMGHYVGGDVQLEFNASPLASVAVSHDLPMLVNSSRSEQHIEERAKVATWLRKWADGIEGIGE